MISRAKYLFIASLAAAPAYADQVPFNWLAVTEDINGGPSQVDAYGLNCDQDQAKLDGNAQFTTGRLSPDILTFTFDLPVGTWYCAAAAHNGSGWSMNSNIVQVTVAPPLSVPKPPFLSKG